MKKGKFVGRHGDLDIFELLDGVPSGSIETGKNVLQKGEHTGHSHTLVLERPTDAKVFDTPEGIRAFSVFADEVKITHQEHHTRTLPKGDYMIEIENYVDPIGEMRKEVVD